VIGTVIATISTYSRCSKYANLTGVDPGICVRGSPSPSFLSPPFLFRPLLPLSLPFHPFSLPSEVGPLKPARGFGQRCKLPSRVRGRAPAENEFNALYIVSQKYDTDVIHYNFNAHQTDFDNVWQRCC